LRRVPVTSQDRNALRRHEPDAMSEPLPTRPESGDAAAVIGVVVAGVLASFVIPGPYSWDTMMLGALMLIILLGFAEIPQTRREAAGVAAAMAFALLFLLGRLVDDTLNLSRWPEWDEGVADDGTWTAVRENLDRPKESSGWETLLFWLGLFIVSLFGLRLLVTKRGKNTCALSQSAAKNATKNGAIPHISGCTPRALPVATMTST
jgi:hypothetical protein